jgi:hypothetical protein
MIVDKIKQLLTESKKEFIGDCVSNPFGKEIYDVKDGGKEISKKKFIDACDVDSEVLKDMKQYPNDYKYFYNKDKDIYFFTHSAIEYFYK